MRKLIWLLFVIVMATIANASFPYPAEQNPFNHDPINPFNASNVFSFPNTSLVTGVYDSANWSTRRVTTAEFQGMEAGDWKYVNDSSGIRFGYGVSMNNESSDEGFRTKIFAGDNPIGSCDSWAIYLRMHFGNIVGTSFNGDWFSVNWGTTDIFFRDEPGTGEITLEYSTDDSSTRHGKEFNEVATKLRIDEDSSLFIAHVGGCSGASGNFYLFLNGTNQTDIGFHLQDTITNTTFSGDPGIGCRILSSGTCQGGIVSNMSISEFIFWHGDAAENMLAQPWKIGALHNGNYTNFSAPLDTTKPNITLINFTSDGGSVCNNASVTPYPSVCANTSDGTPTFAITTSENAAVRGNITETNYSNMNTNATPNDFSTTSLTWTQPYNLDEGRYVFYFTVLDAAGNNQTTPLPENFKANLTINYAPQVNFSTQKMSNNGTTSYNFLMINITANDSLNVGNISLSLYNLTDKVFFNSTIVDTSVVSLYSNITNLPDANYTANGTAIDMMNRLNNTIHRNFTIDRTSPQIYFADPTAPNDANYTNSFLNVSVSVYDIHLSNITIILYDASNLTINRTTKSNSANFSINFTLAAGTYYFNVSSCDVVFNCNETVARKVTISTAVPQINWTTPILPEETYNFNFIYVNVTSSSVVFKNLTIYLYNGSGALVNSSSSLNNTFFKNYTDLYFGTWKINATAYDINEQKNSTNTRTYVLQRNTSFNLTANTSIEFLINGSSILHAIGQNSTKGILNISNRAGIPVVLRLKVNFTNNPFHQQLVDSDFYNWSLNRNSSINTTWNYTHFCAGFVPVNNFSTAGDFSGRLQYRFRNNATYQRFNGSDYLNNSVSFDCPQNYELRKQINYNITGNYSNFSIDVLGDASNNTIHVYINTTVCGNLTLLNVSWQTIRCNLPSLSKPFNITINLTNVSSIINVSSVYFDNAFYFNNSLISEYIIFRAANNSDINTAINLTSDFKTISTINGNEADYIWVWAQINRTRLPLGLLFDIISEFQ